MNKKLDVWRIILSKKHIFKRLFKMWYDFLKKKTEQSLFDYFRSRISSEHGRRFINKSRPRITLLSFCWCLWDVPEARILGSHIFCTSVTKSFQLNDIKILERLTFFLIASIFYFKEIKFSPYQPRTKYCALFLTSIAKHNNNSYILRNHF